MKAIRAFIKPFEAPQRSVEIKIKLVSILIQFSEMYRMGSVINIIRAITSMILRIKL